METEICLWCEKAPTACLPTDGVAYACLDDGRTKFWSLCLPCYLNCMCGDQLSFDAYRFKNKYWKTFETYGVLKEKKQKAICLWYSVRPKENDEKKFIKRIEKFVSSKVIKKGVYTFEWKYENDLKINESIHCHMLLYGEMKQIGQHIGRQKEKYWNLNTKQRFIIYDKKLVNEKLDYISGKTWEDGKNIEKELDKKSRAELGLKDKIYINCVTL